MKIVDALTSLIGEKEAELKRLREAFDAADANNPGDANLIQQKIKVVAQQLDWLQNLEKKMKGGAE